MKALILAVALLLVACATTATPAATAPVDVVPPSVASTPDAAPTYPPLGSSANPTAAPTSAATPAPTKAPLAVPTAAPPPLLLTVSGSAISEGDATAVSNSMPFNWSGSAVQVNWTYSCPPWERPGGNFIVDFFWAGDPLGHGIVNEFGKKGADSTIEYHLSGALYHLAVVSECDWTIKAYGRQ